MPAGVTVQGGGQSSSPVAACSSPTTTALGASASAAACTSAFVTAENLAVLSERGRLAVEKLVAFDAASGDQEHVYGNWPEAGTDDEDKLQLAEQVRINTNTS